MAFLGEGVPGMIGKKGVAGQEIPMASIIQDR
jgi:hypothetical protein